MKVSIIVTAYVPQSKNYLDLCMDSIANLSYKDLEVIIVSPKRYAPTYPNARTISPDSDDYWNGHAINFGVEHSSGEYLFIINDDVILTTDCIEPLIHALSYPQIGQVMPVSNDQQGRYYFEELLIAFKFNSDLKIEESPYDDGLIFADTLCLYAHMLTRLKWNEIGPMDDKSGLIDIDYSLRVRQKGYVNAIELSSLVWHFGGRSVEHTLNNPMRKKQQDMFRAKWGMNPP